jgi:5-methylcytosine-specific restriction protein A
MTKTRAFRTPESLGAERETRAMLAPFLTSIGFQVIEDHRQPFGASESQTIKAITPSGEHISMRVKLCWRFDREGKSRGYSAAQLVAKTKPGKWQEGLEGFVDRMRSRGVTHLLVVQADGKGFADAASIALDAVVPIWIAQRDESNRLISLQAMGRRRKNHAVNGGSPTLYLKDDKAPSVPEKLWKHPGVTDLVKLPVVSKPAKSADTYDDLGLDPEIIGRDAAERIQVISSGVRRDPAVRRAVIKRSKGVCERPGCGAKRDYDGFLDVHHILGAETSDRPWTCVALCPNCHREAHASPDRDALNLRLLEFARQFSPITP